MMVRRVKSVISLSFQFAILATTAAGQAPRVESTAQESGTDALLIAVSPVNDSIVWVSGTGGTAGLTLDGGMTWNTFAVPGADTLQFRDVHGVDAKTAYLLSAGDGPASRIYKTADGGDTWTVQFVNPGPGGFFDCFDFWDSDNGIAFSDSHDGSFILVVTSDGGSTWKQVPAEALPRASAGEGSFAASGTCLQTLGDSTVVVGTGAGASARLLRSDNRGVTWEAFDTPIAGGTATSGISSLAFLDERHGYAFGLDLSDVDRPIQNAARTHDGGETWAAVTPAQIPDVYGGAIVPETDGPALLVTGPKGIDYSPDGGERWISLTKLDHWGIAFQGPYSGWAVGPGGRITKLTVIEANR